MLCSRYTTLQTDGNRQCSVCRSIRPACIQGIVQVLTKTYKSWLQGGHATPYDAGDCPLPAKSPSLRCCVVSLVIIPVHPVSLVLPSLFSQSHYYCLVSPRRRGPSRRRRRGAARGRWRRVPCRFPASPLLSPASAPGPRCPPDRSRECVNWCHRMLCNRKTRYLSPSGNTKSLVSSRRV